MQFLSAQFLWGLLAVGVPVIIHLLQLRRPHRILFTNTGFIREVELTTMRRRRLQELLVLLVRVLGVCFLVLAFAQPFIPSHEVNITGKIGVLVDNSPSMLVSGTTESTLLADAVSQGAALAKNYGAAARFQLLGQSEATLTPVAYTNKLEGLYSAGRQVAWDGVPAHQRVQKQSALYVFSDFQRSERSKAALQKFATSGGRVVLVPQVAREVGNVYADSVWLDDAFVRTRVNLGLHIRLRNGGTKPYTDCPVKVRIGGRQVAAFSVSLNAGQVITTVAQVQLADTQLALGQVVTEDAPIVFDNVYYFTLQPTAAIRIVEIGAEPVAQKAYEAEKLFVYSFVQPQRINYSELRQANLVIVNGVKNIEAGLREALVNVVRRGGSVVVVPPSEGIGREATLQLLQALGIGGGQWESTGAGSPVLREVALPSPRDPFFSDVFGPQPRQVVMPQVAPVLQVGRGGTDILRLRDGDSYLVEYGSKQTGHTYVFTAPFAAAYGDFTTQSLFVPVLYRLAMTSYHTSQQLAYRVGTTAIGLEVPAATAENSRLEEPEFRLIRDSLTLLPAQRLRGNILQLDVPAELSQPGFYELRRRGQRVATLAFNAERKESELATYSATELRQLAGPTVQVLDGTNGLAALAAYQAKQSGQPLWRYCLLGVLGCLLAEGLLLRFGKAKTLGLASAAA